MPNLSLVDIDAIRHDNERGVERRGIQCRVRHTKCRIRNIDRGTHVNAYCNPDQIVIEKAVPWETASQSKGDAPILEFRNAEPMFLSCTLAFGDCSSQANVYEAHVEALTALTLIATAAKTKTYRANSPSAPFWSHGLRVSSRSFSVVVRGSVKRAKSPRGRRARAWRRAGRPTARRPP